MVVNFLRLRLSNQTETNETLKRKTSAIVEIYWADSAESEEKFVAVPFHFLPFYDSGRKLSITLPGIFLIF